MIHSGTILKQLVALVPGYEFDILAACHHSGQKFRSFNRWSPFKRRVPNSAPILQRQLTVFSVASVFTGNRVST